MARMESKTCACDGARFEARLEHRLANVDTALCAGRPSPARKIPGTHFCISCISVGRLRVTTAIGDLVGVLK
jgi:hypothetical protein